MIFFSSLKARFSMALWAMGVASTLTAVFATAFFLIGGQMGAIRDQLKVAAHTLEALGLSDFSRSKDFAQFDEFLEDALQMGKVGKVVRVFDSQRNLVFTSAGLDYDRLPQRLDAEVKKSVFLSILGKKRHYESIIVPYKGKSNKKRFYLQVAIPTPSFLYIMKTLWWQGLLLFTLLAVASVFVAQFLSRRLLKPVYDISGYIESVDPANIEAWQPLSINEKGEFMGIIVDGINRFGGRTRDAILHIRRMSRYVAHELRAPLTVIQGEAETVLMGKNVDVDEYRRVIASSLEEVKRMSDIINTVMSIGDTAGGPPRMKIASVNLKEWTGTNLPAWERSLGRGINVEITAEEVERVHCDEKLIFRLVDNLVRNVAVHTPSETVCTLSLKNSHGGVVMVVEDDGPGMSEGRLAAINSKGISSEFVRVGLHLCIRLAELMGLELVFSNRRGGGLSVSILFPAK